MIKNTNNLKNNLQQNSIHRKLINQRKTPQDPYKKVARNMETQFLQHMLQEMQKTVHKDKEDSTQTKYYNSLLNYEHAKVMAEKNEGKGIQKLILDQIMPSSRKYTNNTNQIISAYKKALEQQEKQ